MTGIEKAIMIKKAKEIKKERDEIIMKMMIKEELKSNGIRKNG